MKEKFDQRYFMVDAVASASCIQNYVHGILDISSCFSSPP